MARSICGVALAFSAALAAAACISGCGPGGDGQDDGGGPDGDGEIDGSPDGDGDVDADGDGDADADADADAEGDADADPDVERDLSRCGDGTDGCGACHGAEADPAPPPDTSGLTDPAEVTVGAHGAHLSASEAAAAVSCDECHGVPTDVLDLGHCDSPAPAEVRFGRVASADGTFPVWNRETGSCSMVYCHGATLDQGSEPSPVWTAGGPMDCGSCHRRSYHGQTGCDCHGTVWAGGTIIAPSRHVNGRVDM